MIPKGVLIGFGSGAMAAVIFGLLITNVEENNPMLEYVEGYSLSIITEKTDFALGQPITIRIVNSGSEPLTFSDSSYGFKITGLDGRIVYSPPSAQVISVLEPKEERTFMWEQTKTNLDKIIQGRYKIVSSTIGETVLKESLVINIYK